jgi:hypothetical protein
MVKTNKLITLVATGYEFLITAAKCAQSVSALFMDNA